MKVKKKLMLSCCAAFAFALVCVGMKIQMSLKTNAHDLTTQNVEALAGNEGSEEEGISDCPGEAIFADVGVMNGEATLRLHFCDSIDVVSVQSYKKCYASGMGKTKGNNDYIWDITTKSEKHSECLGWKYHKNSIYDEQ